MTDTALQNTLNTGSSLYREAKKIIPGGTQLLSKRPELFLPEQWPTYYRRASGCTVWDMDDRPLIDMMTTGIGACLLGYADPDVNSAAKEAIDRGTMTSLNPHQEVELAKVLCEIHPWAHMVRYARAGGEAMAVAVRIARAASGRDKVAVCGYHGWSDWYLAANLGEVSNLDGHLLPGLQPTGVPRGLAGTAIPFEYNKIDQLEQLVKQHGTELGAIVMEPLRFESPVPGYMERVREIADRHKLVLVFDEITAGWRHNLGGVHLQLGVEPDIAVFAKSISNGFPMAAIVGRREVMQAAESSFISSTYWTEAVGFSTAMATIAKMKQEKVAEHVGAIGGLFQEEMRKLAKRHGLKIHVSGWPALTHYAFEYGDQKLAVQTLFTQLMLERGFLAASAFYPTLAHTSETVMAFIGAADDAMGLLAEAIKADDVQARLNGPVAHSGFRRLN